MDCTRIGTPRCMEKDCRESQDFLSIMRHEGQCSIHQESGEKTNNDWLDHRASLENDVKQLQMHLHQEKYVRLMLEKAIGRASSTLSPGHRHFTSKTRGLIAEITLLEEEIANREQHVLSLYRTIFDQCASGPSSEQNSNISSPAHTKNGLKKHPSIIASAFCSSKNFRLRPIQALSSIKEYGKGNMLIKSKGRHESLLKGNSNIHAGINSSIEIKLQDSVGHIARTLKDHLFECPSKLSEEMVRCMASIYCWVRKEAPSKPGKSCSPFLSRSSTSVFLPRRSGGDHHEWSSRPLVEISSISMDESHFSSASCAINNYRLMVEQLESVDVSVLENGTKLAFWINIYNSLVMHSYLAYGIPRSSLRRMVLFHKAAYKIGGYTITANSIEHIILCCRTPRIGRWLETVISAAMRKRFGDEKQLLGSKFGIISPQPLVIFALCTGATSDPMLRVYTGKNVLEELEKAKKDFLQTGVVVKKSRVFLPKILDWYAKEASLSPDELFAWASDNVDKRLHEAINKCTDLKDKKRASQVVEWLPFNARFRYVFGKDLMEKPWLV